MKEGRPTKEIAEGADPHPGSELCIPISLQEHCIQTAARRLHARMRDRILTSEQPDPVETEALTLLGEFLERSDFRALRAERPELSGGHPCVVVLRRGPSGELLLDRVPK